MFYAASPFKLKSFRAFALFEMKISLSLFLLYCIMQYHNDTIIKTQEDFFNKIYTSHFICKVRKGCSRFACERELETEQKLQHFDPTLMAVSVVSFSFSSTAQPKALGPSSLLNDGFLYCILSTISLGPNSIGALSPFGLVWLSLPHLVYNSVRTATV